MFMGDFAGRLSGRWHYQKGLSGPIEIEDSIRRRGIGDGDLNVQEFSR
jgi:hypothetical protein